MPVYPITNPLRGPGPPQRLALARVSAGFPSPAADDLEEEIESQNVLTLSRRYFQLRKPMERRLYELARKHCGVQRVWRIGLDKLQHKTGSSSTSKEFKRLVKAICLTDEEQSHMPDYNFRLMHDILEVSPKLEFTDVYAEQPVIGAEVTASLSSSAYEKGRDAAPGWDVYFLEQEWRNWMSEPPRDVDAAFVGFCRKWYERRGRP